MIEYSSNAGDVVCDFFMGNFTTAYCSVKLDRDVVGFEMNKESYDYHEAELQKFISEIKGDVVE